MFCIQPVVAEGNNVWDVLREEFAINHETSNPEVQKQIRWIMAHPEYTQKLAKSEPFIYHIITEIKKHNLPGELALIPMIESTYNPFAYSKAGASGLWQIMPGTGRDFGLKQNWWSDSRRGINSSTQAALKYLKYLNTFFQGNWLLAIAAYDAGEGSISRIIKKYKKNKKTAVFWSLPMPRETHSYIPKLLALAEVIKNPQKYHIKLPHIELKPYFQEVDVGSQIDLSDAAKLAGIPYQTLIKLNPEYNRWATSPYLPYKLLIPINNVNKFKQSLASIPKNKLITWSRHKVAANDNLQKLAQQYNTSPDTIKKINQLKTASIKNEEYILIPQKNAANKTEITQKPSFTTPEIYKVVHIVSNNDSYNSIQKKYNISNKQLIQWNPKLALTQKPLPGQSIIIWKQNNKNLVYVVKKGDNISTIAMNNNKKIHDIVALNPNLKINKIKPGQEIKIS